MLGTGGVCLEMCWARRRNNCQWGCKCKYLHYVNGGSEKHIMLEARRMREKGPESYIWRWKATQNTYNVWKQEQMAKQSEASIANSQKVYKEAPSEHRFDRSKARFLTYYELKAELEEQYPLTDEQVQKRWDELERLPSSAKGQQLQ